MRSQTLWWRRYMRTSAFNPSGEGGQDGVAGTGHEGLQQVAGARHLTKRTPHAYVPLHPDTSVSHTLYLPPLLRRLWGHTWPGHFLPSDRVGHWSDKMGAPYGLASMEFDQVAPKLPNDGWR